MELSDLYLSDGVSQIDYVIVYSVSNLNKRRYFKKIFENLLTQLDELNADYEIANSTVNKDLRCLKIHISNIILEEYAKFHNIEIFYKSNALEMGEEQGYCKCLHTVLTRPNLNNDITRRIRTMGSRMEPTLTQTERIFLSHLVLSSVKFGDGFDQHGLERIRNIGAIKAVFPLHEGKTEWSEDGVLTQRQLLARFWTSLKNTIKIQPVNAIERYFGPELAFFYGYLQLCTEMQLVASILGVMFFVTGIFAESKHSKAIREYICTSDKLICPTCHPKYCKAKPLKTYCSVIFRMNQTFDNVEMFLLGICITLWGTIFVEVWKRRQTLYRLRWHLTSLRSDLQIREGYEERTNLFIVNPFTNELEPTMSIPNVTARGFLSAASVVLLICSVFGIEIFVIMLKEELKKSIDQDDSPEIIHKNADTIVSVVGSTGSVLVILTIDAIYKTVSKVLTDWENPRTQKQYDNSFMMKCFLFAFANNYSMVLYIAFFKGRFFSNPSDETITNLSRAYKGDTCQLGECNSDLAVQIMVILGVKHLFIKCVGRYLFSVSYVVWKTYKRKKKSSDVMNEQWERDYILTDFERYDIMKKYIEIILRHSLVLFFTSVCPFTPLLTFIVNIVEMKLYSYAYVYFYKRPIPRKVQGIEMFYFILQALTWIGVTVNAVLALMTKHFGKMHFYMGSVDNDVKAYMDKTFSVFSMEDYPDAIKRQIMQETNSSFCYYPGNRYPPDHPRKYEEQEDLYRFKAFGWMMVVVYVHVVFLITRIIAKIIPDSSTEVTDHLNSANAENRRDLRIFRNQQYQSKKSRINFQDEAKKD